MDIPRSALFSLPSSTTTLAIVPWIRKGCSAAGEDRTREFCISSGRLFKWRESWAVNG